MTKLISEYTVDELSAKIEAIKSERERTANALKKYEEELERRKQEVHLGVPFIPKNEKIYWFINDRGNVYDSTNENTPIDYETIEFLSSFHSKESAQKHAEMLLAWRKALVSNAKGEPIDIKVLLPLMKKGWVAMDKNGNWYWYSERPELRDRHWSFGGGNGFNLSCFNIKPAENWENSLTECGL